LKPYDLVWVEGKSAAWRYPSEVEELKLYAPAVEEQPYDRFFKKASKSSTESVNNSSEQQKEILKESQNQVAEKNNERKIFVSMSEKNNGSGQYQQYQPKPDQEAHKPAEEKEIPPIIVHETEDSTPVTKYSQSLDEIKEMYIHTLVNRKTRTKRKELIKKILKPGLAAVGLIASGIAIGLFLFNKKNSSSPAANIIPSQKQEERVTQNKEQILPEEKKPETVMPDVNEKNQSKDTDQVVIPLADKKQINTTEIKQTFSGIKTTNDKKEKKINTDKSINETFADIENKKITKKDVEIDSRTGERKKTVRNDNDATSILNKKENQNDGNSQTPAFIETESKNIYKLVSVKSNKYIRGVFGGIRDLEITVLNDSKFLIDEVTVELQYIKPSELPLRTDIITFKNISPNGAETIKIPDSQRGIRVNYRITNIESHQWEKATAGL
jgi:hypothetical protein